MNNRDFIIFGLQPWDIPIGSTCKYTAMEIARKNRVLFVNPPVVRSSLIKNPDDPQVQRRKRILAGTEPALQQISPSMWVLYPRMISESINWIPVHSLFLCLNYLNERKFAARIREAVRELNFTNYIILNDNSMLVGYHLKELLHPALYIYLLRDAVTMVAYHKKHGARMEPRLISRSDLTVTNSDYFCRFALKHNPNSHMIGQGCDVSMYSDPGDSLQIPSDVASIHHPRIGYTGALTTIRLDPGILEYVAKARPDWNLVLVGPEDDIFKNSSLHHMPNVYFLGRKDPSELPGYVKSFDVAINPQIVNPITDINYPLKIDEYLAMGKPVVATKTTFMDYFRDHTYLASDYKDWVTCIEWALKENNTDEVARRKALAAEHSWENFVDKIYKLAEKTINKQRIVSDE